MQTKTGVIFIQKNKFQLYSPYIANILEFNFVPELARDYDLVNKELFSNLLKTFLANNKVPAGSMIMMIGDNASFIKDFTNSQPAPLPPATQGVPANQPTAPTLVDLQADANEFLEHVPFDVVASKTYPLPNGIRAYATNQEMYDVIKETLEKEGFIISMIVPSFAFGTEMSGLNGLNINAINTIFQKLNIVKEYNLLSNPKSIVEDFMASTAAEEKEKRGEESSGVEIEIREEKKANKPIVLIVAVSLIVIVVLGTVGILYWQFANPPYKPPPPTAPAVVSPTPAAQLPSDSGTVEAKNLTVQIVNSTASPAASRALETELQSFGFKQVTTRVQSDLQTSQPLIIFSPNVTAEIKQSVSAQVRNVLPDILGQDKSDTNVDIVIITGQ